MTLWLQWPQLMVSLHLGKNNEDNIAQLEYSRIIGRCTSWVVHVLI